MKKADFKRETKMESKQIDSILRELSQRRLVKPVKREGKKDNIWVRYDSVEEEAGGKVDTNIVEVLKEAEGNIEDLRAEFKRKGVNTQDMDTVVAMLVNRGLKFLVDGRLTNRRIRPLVNPCVGCPVFDLCTADGPISPATCIYYEEW